MEMGTLLSVGSNALDSNDWKYIVGFLSGIIGSIIVQLINHKLQSKDKEKKYNKDFLLKQYQVIQESSFRDFSLTTWKNAKTTFTKLYDCSIKQYNIIEVLKLYKFLDLSKTDKYINEIIDAYNEARELIVGKPISQKLTEEEYKLLLDYVQLCFRNLDDMKEITFKQIRKYLTK